MLPVVSLLLLLTPSALPQLQNNVEMEDTALPVAHHSVWTDQADSCPPYRYSCGKPAVSDSTSPDLAEQLIEGLHAGISRAAEDLAHPGDYPPHYMPQDGEEFDFVVVGAGSAGAVVAHRLSEVRHWRVLLLEAGGDPTKVSEVPGLFFALGGPGRDWGYLTEPEDGCCLGMTQGRCYWPRGKVLGGSSTINYMVYVRGHCKDFDAWAAAGHAGWGYDDVLPYFKKSEDLRHRLVLDTEGVDKYHGRGGHLKVESWNWLNEKHLTQVFQTGYEELGYPFNPDCNGQNQTGFTPLQATLQDRRRCSTAKAFLTSIKGRDNLKVSKHSLVTRVLISKDSMTADGVEFLDKKGDIIRVRAKKEVILSAGAINSPQILMLSGVGPNKHLKDLGIDIIKDLPVGENLQDHQLMLGVVLTVNYTPPPLPSLKERMFEFLTHRAGPLSTIGDTAWAAFINTSPGEDYPDIEILQAQMVKNDTSQVSMFLKLLGLSDESIEKFVKINEKAYSIILAPSLLRPYSRGRILLRDANPKSHPRLIAGYLTDRRDVETFLRTYDFIERLMQTEALKRMKIEMHEVQLPACEVHGFPSSAHRECTLRHLTSTTYHLSGSCAMGAVVDDTLRVQGIHRLRVVDASIMPTIVSGHTNAATIMIAEKASDLIKQTWNGHH